MRKEKYILQVMGMHSYKYGGLERFLVSLAEELNKHHFKLILLYDSFPNSGIFLKRLNELKVELFVTNSLHPLRFLIDYMRILFKYKPIIVHAHFQPFYAVFYASLLGFKNRWVSLRLMMIDQNNYELSDLKELRLRTRIHQWIFILCSTKFLAVSNAVKLQFKKLYPETESRLEVFYMGAHTNNFQKKLTRKTLNFTNDYIYIGCVAFCDKMKGVDILIEASRVLKKLEGIENFKICLIGMDETSSFTNDLKKLALSYNLEDNIIWLGLRDNVPELLSAMNIYCQPSRTEAISFAIMEAGMAGLPCVGSNIGGIPEVILHNQTGFLYKVGDIVQLANYIKVLILNESLRKKMGVNAREHMIRNFNIEVQAKKMAQIYLNSSRRIALSD